MAPKENIHSILSTAIEDRSAYFVFPSGVAAQGWARRLALRTGKPIDSARFLAWDDFKRDTLSSHDADRMPANAMIRTLFTAQLLEANAEYPRLNHVLPPEHASGFMPFVASISASLPGLSGILSAEAALSHQSSYFSDLRFIHAAYTAFMDKHHIYEPSWSRAPFNAKDCRWILFFPDLAEDWDEYEAELSAHRSVTLFAADTLAAETVPEVQLLQEALEPLSGKLSVFPSAREELRWLVRSIRRLLDDFAFSPSDIVVSVPNLDGLSRRIEEEFTLFDIPVHIHAGKTLAKHAAGQLFDAIAACADSRWCFQALKDLLLNQAWPWKNRECIDGLISFGLKYRCVSGFRDNGRDIDVWEQSFRRFGKNWLFGNMQLSDIQAFYSKLKKSIQSVVAAPDFTQLRASLQTFKSAHFDEKSLRQSSNDVLAKALEELNVLVETTARLNGLRFTHPFKLYRQYLGSIPYVFQHKSGGVPVYPYRVSAGLAPRVHFVLNMTQEAATVRVDKAPLLREDRKEQLRLLERDLSARFIQTYGYSGRFVLFSAAMRGFGQQAIPHIAFTERAQQTDLPTARRLAGDDPFAQELELFRKMSPGPATAAQSGLTIASCQQRALSYCLQIDYGKRQDFRLNTAPTFPQVPILMDRLTHANTGACLSPSDLNAFYECPFAWFLRKGLSLEELQTEIETVDQREVGMLYHAVLSRLFQRIFDGDARFRAEKRDQYIDMLSEELSAELESAARREGAFQDSVYEMLERRIRSTLEDFLDMEASRLDAAALIGSEHSMQTAIPGSSMSLAGKADLALRRNDGSLHLIDFKTNKIPAAADSYADDDAYPADFQMPAYIRLLEATEAAQVQEAYFFSLDMRKRSLVLTDTDSKPKPREDYDSTLQSLDNALAACAERVEARDFRVPPPGERRCGRCLFRAVCRITYAGGER